MMKSWFRPTIENAPCPPFFVDNVYDLLILETERNNLTSNVVEAIRIKCSVETPTTSTTTTKTTPTPRATTLETTKTTPTPRATTPVSEITLRSETIPPTTPKTTATTTESSFKSETLATKETTGNGIKTINTSLHTTTLRDQTISEHTSDKSSTYMSNTSGITTQFTSQFTYIPNENRTVENVTIATDLAKETAYSSGCKGICIIGIASGAVCMSLLLLLVIAIVTFHFITVAIPRDLLLRMGARIRRKTIQLSLFRRRKESRSRSGSRSRSRFGDMPDVNMYESVDIGESSKRSSGSSLFRRSCDFSRSPPVVFDNAAYRRSAELRPRRYNSWYDPDATDYYYSQNNANLINRKSRSPERRSLSTSRLNEKRVSEHQRHGSSSLWHPSIHDYVPKVIHSTSEGDFGRHSRYHYNSQSDLLLNEIRIPQGGQSPPRTLIKNKRKAKDKSAKLKQSYRSRSFDPDMSGGSSPWEESHLYSMDKDRSRIHFTKRNQSKKNADCERNVKINKRRDKTPDDKEIVYDIVFRRNSGGRNIECRRPLTKNSCKDRFNQIISSDIRPVSFRYGDQIEDHIYSPIRSNDERSADFNDHLMGHDKSFRNADSCNNRRYNSTHSCYKQNSNGIHMLQTRL